MYVHVFVAVVNVATSRHVKNGTYFSSGVRSRAKPTYPAEKVHTPFTKSCFNSFKLHALFYVQLTHKNKEWTSGISQYLHTIVRFTSLETLAHSRLKCRGRDCRMRDRAGMKLWWSMRQMALLRWWERRGLGIDKRRCWKEVMGGGGLEWKGSLSILRRGWPNAHANCLSQLFLLYGIDLLLQQRTINIGQTNLSHDSLNSAHVLYIFRWTIQYLMNSSSQWYIGRPNMEGSKSTSLWMLGCHKPCI